MKTVLVTGAAGFIGFHLAKRLLDNGERVVGYDNLNSYYDISLKYSRLDILREYDGFTFIKGDLADKEAVDGVFAQYTPGIVINLAAQAGVRYSIENPRAYIDSNITGFFNILEACRHNKPERLIYASSSSVYGNQDKTPFSENDNVDNPVSLYAATKKSNELMAYTYSHLYGIKTTGLRFFTVYGEYGRPDMAYFKFAEKIMKGEHINVYNNGDMYRDFTYIGDIVDGIVRLLSTPARDYKIYNLGNNKPEKLITFIETLEYVLDKKAVRKYLPMQAGDVYKTCADISSARNDFGFDPKTGIADGLARFAGWFAKFYQHKGINDRE